MQGINSVRDKIKNGSLYVVVIVALIIYIVFFASKLFMGDTVNDPTRLDSKVNFEPYRTISILNLAYDKERETMRIMVNIDNLSDDRIDSYYFKAVDTKKKLYDIKILFENINFSVLEIKGVKKNFHEMKLLAGAKIKPMEELSDDEIAQLIINKKNITEKKISKNYNNVYYNKLFFDKKNNASYKKIGGYQKEIDALKESIKGIDKFKAEFDKNKAFMTENEVKEEENKIVLNDLKKEEINKDIEKIENKINKEQRKIKERNLLLDKIKNEM